MSLDLSALVADATSHAWFAATGDALTAADRADAALASGGRPIVAVSDWAAAKAVLTGSAWDAPAWQADDAERRQLLEHAATRHGRAAVLAALSEVMAAATSAQGAAAIAVARAGLADPGLIKVASGAVAEALDRAALVTLAAAGEHRFLARYRLYLAGRWPLGAFGEGFAVL